MWGNILILAVRRLFLDRAYSAINIGGLALGLAGCLMILNYVNYERSYDRWLPDSARVFQVQSTWHGMGQPVAHSQNSPYPVHDALPAGFPQIEAMTSLRTGPTVLTRNGKPLFIDSTGVDHDFFKVFQLPFAYGSAETALPNPNTVVLTETEAIRQFGTADVVGRTIALGAGEGRHDHVVSGVLRDLPGNTSLKLAILFYVPPYPADAQASLSGWGAMQQQHFVKLRSAADAATINAALPAWEKRTIPPEMRDGKPLSPADTLDLSLAPITGIHLGTVQQDAIRPGGDARTLATFAIVALLILGMAAMNFVNLSTARAVQRAREVALRKLLGASRGQLIAQFFAESVLLSALAMLFALSAVELATPWVGNRVGADLHMAYLGSDGMLVPALVLFLVTALAGGLYPAFYLARFRPAVVLRANRASAETPGSGRLRSALVVLQFAVAIGLIVCTWVIFEQTRFVQTVDPGYRRDGLVQLDSAWRFAGDASEYAAGKHALLKIPGVVGVARTNLGIASTSRNAYPVRLPGAPADLSLGFYGVDTDFFQTMEMRLLAGRTFSDAQANDRLIRPGYDDTPAQIAALEPRGLNLVVNRNAARLLGFAVPQDAVGKPVKVGVEELGLVPATIIGVVEDTRIRTARDAIEPIVYGYDPQRLFQVVVRYTAARPSQVMDGIEKVWRRFEPEIPFQGRFAEDIVREVYAADLARGALFAGFSALGVIIACLGLYSLAAFATERRTKEIGIRKVVGARVRDIVRLLVWQFSKPVVLANLIAWPVAWWAMRDWLNTFDARIALGPGPFAVAGIIAFIIAVATVAGQSFRVARMNPVHALRYE
ncbi:MAG: ABC transporter permease [Pseudomonadota bacterium]